MTNKAALIRDSCLLIAEQFDTPAAHQMLAAIAFQESDFIHRRQIKGPAKGFWQFELAGILGVRNHDSTYAWANYMCDIFRIENKAYSMHQALEYNDQFAATMARLLLWTDPRPLPTTQQEGWEYYLRNWRPGKPRPEKWPESWQKAIELLNPNNKTT